MVEWFEKAWMVALVIRASLRVAWLNRRVPLDEMVNRLRTTRRLPSRMCSPERFQQLVNRWYLWLPPYGLRACLKRSFLLLDLWSRCGLTPKFHLGVRRVGGERDGHAWVTADGVDGGEMSSEGYVEALVV